MGNFVRHEPCPECGSKDNLARYDDGSAHCFGCSYNEYSESANRKNKITNKHKQTRSKLEVSKEVITSEKAEEIKQQTTFKANNFRGIRDDILKYFRVLNSVDEFGEVLERYYPVTQDGALVGYKVREIPKTFYSIGRTGADCELFCQFRFTRGGKYVIITEGEEDTLAAYQMLKDYNKSKGSDFETAVVSATTGANSHKQIAAQYKFFDSFENIIISYDNDKPGLEAIDKIVKVLPKGKVRIMSNRYKDANEYLEKGAEKAFLNDFYNAKTYVPAGVVGSNTISSAMIEELMVEKIPLPPFMHKLQEMMAGGIPLGRIVNLGSASGTGKSTIIDEMIYYWIFKSPHMVGIVTLESSVGQYGIKLLSRHVSKKIELLSNENALKFVAEDEIKAKEKELFEKENGDPRFYLLDDRDSDIEDIKSIVEEMIISCNCKVIVLDPLQDILEGMSEDQERVFMRWQKSMVKRHQITFININHVRKNNNSQKANSTGADLHEEDFHGSSSIFKSGACNLLFTRDKENEDEVVKNTTRMKATKIRWTGKTGVAGEYYYDCETHTMHDLDDYLNNNFT